MAREIVLDTSVLVGIERGVLDARQAYDSTDDMAISALTAAGVLGGVELAPAERILNLRRKVEDILHGLFILDYDLRVARVHALLIAHARRTGLPRGTAFAYRRVLVTTDARASFGDLPGLDVDVVGQG